MPQKPISINLLFSSFEHGWKKDDWRKKVIGKEKTLTIMKSTKGKVCGGYLHIMWQEKGGATEDNNAFLFSLDHQTKFTPNPEAVYFNP